MHIAKDLSVIGIGGRPIILDSMKSIGDDDAEPSAPTTHLYMYNINVNISNEN